MMNCKEATTLSLEKSERKLTFSERLKLWFHFVICKYCKRASLQMKWIEESVHEYAIKDSLTDPERDTMKTALKSTPPQATN